MLVTAFPQASLGFSGYHLSVKKISKLVSSTRQNLTLLNWDMYFPSLLKMWLHGFDLHRMAKPLPRWDVTGLRSVMVSSEKLTDGWHMKPDTNQNGQWVKAWKWMFFLQSWTEKLRNLSDKSEGERIKERFTSPPFLPYPPHPFSTVHLKLGVLPLEGSMNLGKTCSFLFKKMW